MGSASCHSVAPQAMKMVGVAWTCLGSVDGDIPKVKKAWLSLLCRAQYLMIDKDAKNETWWSGPRCDSMWRDYPEHGNGTLVDIVSTGCGALGLARNGRTRLGYLKRTHESILVQRVRLRPPTNVGSEGRGLLTRHRLICSFQWTKANPEQLLMVAALSGFKQMQVFV